MSNFRSLGAVGSLNFAVFHDWNPERLFVIFTIFADESGTHAGSPVMTLGGRIARVGQWIDFDYKWRRLLKREGLAYFHGTEFRNRRDQFKGWSAAECDRFLAEANKIVGKHTLYGFAVTMNHDDYKNVYRAASRPRKVKVDSKYGLCFRIALRHLPRMIGRSLKSGDHQVNFVLESGDPGSGDAKAIFDEAKNSGQPWARILGTLSYGDKKQFPGLQAADLIAFSAYHVEQTETIRVIRLPKNYTMEDARKLAKYKSPVQKLEIKPKVMRDIVAIGIADLEERRRFWKENRRGARSSEAD